ncbi:hypothetical protein ACOSQ4_017373 [Xanthoceras sorbifolium]
MGSPLGSSTNLKHDKPRIYRFIAGFVFKDKPRSLGSSTNPDLQGSSTNPEDSGFFELIGSMVDHPSWISTFLPLTLFFFLKKKFLFLKRKNLDRSSQHKAKRDKTDAPTKDPTAAEAPLASPAGAGAGAKTSLDARATLVMEAATMRTVQEIFFMSMVG